MRMIATLAVSALAPLVAAAPAPARLVYVKEYETARPVVYAATDAGKRPVRLGVGRAPTVSPDGRWVAYVTVPREAGERDQVVVRRSGGGGTVRIVMRSKAIDSVHFSPDSLKVAAVLSGRRLHVYDIGADTVRTIATGELRGYAWSPDATLLALGRATGKAIDAPSDIWIGRATGGALQRLTTTRDSLNPVWGAKWIVFDRQRPRRDDAPAYNLWALDPLVVPRAPRRLTKLSIPRLVSGLVPLELSADSNRLLAVFTGMDTEVGFTVNALTGKTRALSRDFETGIVGFDLSADGRTILGHTGGPDPNQPHDVVTVTFRSDGRRQTLVEDAAYPDWSR